jgi:hypothetical protein
MNLHTNMQQFNTQMKISRAKNEYFEIHFDLKVYYLKPKLL